MSDDLTRIVELGMKLAKLQAQAEMMRGEITRLQESNLALIKQLGNRNETGN